MKKYLLIFCLIGTLLAQVQEKDIALSPVVTYWKTLTIDEFQNRLGAQIPVLEGGDVRKEVESKLKTEFQRNDRFFSKSTSFALKRIEKRGLIKFEIADDANNWILDLGGETEKVSYIKYYKED